MRSCFLSMLCVFAAGCASVDRPVPVSPHAVRLFNGVDLTGWTTHLEDPKADPSAVWSIREGVLHCEGLPMGYVRTAAEYEDYRLCFEWRWPDWEGNSGVLVHCSGPDKVWPRCVEVQLQRDNAGDLWVTDGTDFAERTNRTDKCVVKRHPHNEKKVGRWNRAEIVCRGGSIDVYINGLLQNTASGANVRRGWIAFQSEKAPVDFRNITIEKLQ
jgi:hypothetical protein